MSKPEPEYEIVTEVGIFGNLNIDDPTTKKVKRKNTEIDELIAESTRANLANLSTK
ncbi:hypothetical protein D3C71_1914970 [compost metagenome]